MTPLPPERSDGRTGAILLILAASFIFAVSDAAAKLIIGRIPPLEVMWMRSVVVMVVTLAVVLPRKGLAIFHTRHPWLQLLRGSCVTLASVCFLSGLAHLPVADVSAINFIWPVLVTVFSVLMLKEKVGPRRAAATLAGFIGMIIIIRPGSSAFHPAAVFPLMAAVSWSFASVLTRLMSADEQAETTLLWSAVISLVVTSLCMPFVFVSPSVAEMGVGLFIGLGSAVGHAMIVVAFTRTSASALAPFTYTQLIWAVVCGYAVFGTFPDRWVILGGTIIAVSGIYTAHRERVRRQQEKMG